MRLRTCNNRCRAKVAKEIAAAFMPDRTLCAVYYQGKPFPVHRLTLFNFGSGR